MDEFAPSRLVTQDDGSFSLCFDDFNAASSIMDEKGLQGGGYTWHAIVEALVRLHAPEIQSVVNYDPEGSMFVAYGTDRAALLTVARNSSAVPRRMKLCCSRRWRTRMRTCSSNEVQNHRMTMTLRNDHQKGRSMLRPYDLISSFIAAPSSGWVCPAVSHQEALWS
jgi:Immunity protein 51